jgi:NitT/TauT family transport system permease protein
LIGLIGFVFDYALRLLQRRVLYWVPNGHGRLGGG